MHEDINLALNEIKCCTIQLSSYKTNKQITTNKCKHKKGQ